MDKNKKIDERQCFKDASEAVRTQIVHQFRGLVVKIVTQQYNKWNKKVPWGDIESIAYEGLVMAMNGYDPEKSKMTFAQYAAFSILNNIRNRLTEEVRAVRMTAYGVEKARKEGSSTFNTLSLDSCITFKHEEIHSTKIYYTPIWMNGDFREYLTSRLEERFNEKDRYCFYSYYGLFQYAEKKVSELAKELGVTSGRISQRIKKIVKYIKQDEELMERFGELAEGHQGY